MDNELITIKEAMKMLSVSRHTIKKLIEDGSVESYEIKKKVTRIKRSSLETFLMKVKNK